MAERLNDLKARCLVTVAGDRSETVFLKGLTPLSLLEWFWKLSWHICLESSAVGALLEKCKKKS